jgi:hypothetical protein
MNAPVYRAKFHKIYIVISMLRKLAVHAVSRYPVSGPNSLLYRENTGNFADLGRFRPFSCILMLPHQYLAGDFPKEINREFFILFRE